MRLRAAVWTLHLAGRDGPPVNPVEPGATGRATSNPTAWGRIQAVFKRALGLEGAARAEYLEASCRGDAGLRAEVETLLTADEQSDGGRFIRAAINQAGLSTDPPPPDSPTR